ncbi:lytic transglycosylase domain-containing protein [Glaciimonas sp. Gout2]|uniref:lytic transglycosylase domain-containing protein n=1 Tax=unclassified Glaciimonas TaxID=2644401 RepID=UPI002B238BA6|nr:MULTISPECIES: lytic transglycosylase domain-containing protein [unclassified Glaciimonas]MEB0013928.1 lytic transglycosylase domain-containing protein [Glaciimonas sp. Cout2]MEB0083125.1 lytic transglycosylase domain-containing protein [Glaciimonas sp. Gout2]
MAQCAPSIHPQTFKGLVTTESTFHPYAIGVVNGTVRAPRTEQEAIATARALDKAGYNFSLGLTQVNRYNLARYGETYETIFDPCRNIRAGAAILKDCFVRATVKRKDEQQALRAAFSCYYSGNFTRGFKPDHPGEPSYVQKVVSNALGAAPSPIVPAVAPHSSDAAVVVSAVTHRAASPTAKTRAPAGDWVSFGEGVPVVAPLTDYRPLAPPVAPLQQEAVATRQDDAFVVVNE